MYESYWQLAARPFDHSADARFYYPGPSQQAAMLKLRYVVENRRGAAILAGEAGLGKTLVAQSLLRQLGESFRPRVHLVFPQMPAEQLLAYLADQLSNPIPTRSVSEGHTPTRSVSEGHTPPIDQSLRRIQHSLTEGAQAGRHAVIVIDEAHLLRESRALETIRLLLNFEHNAQPLATFLLVGQTGLALDVQRLPQLDERLAVKCLLSRLTLEETAAYLQHRLAAAGGKRPIFDASAAEEIFELTHGIPRRINRLCDLALLVGYGEELRTLGRGQIQSIYEELIGATPTIAAA
ncbi:MAG: AAA family ATPase [Pirellulaceae bacterium]